MTPAHRYITDEELEAIATLYRHGITIRDIARLKWAEFGYASEETCRRSLYKTLRAAGHTIATLDESNAARATHGYTTRLIRSTPGGRARYLKWWRAGQPQ